ncbi:MAG: 6-carboxytetrahydropterin synthase QueD [Syntrophomonadaceae bacterium]|jgi:6-pyruvoyltetrahydropterin/6-carboxytetrahydropterin synthase
MGFGITVQQEFAAAHRLYQYQGNCSNMHGHTWKVELTVTGDKLDQVGMLIDFRDIKLALAQILEPFDHCCLNDIAPFNQINPTAENLAKYIFDQAKKRLAGYRVAVVRVWESGTAFASYTEDQE